MPTALCKPRVLEKSVVLPNALRFCCGGLRRPPPPPKPSPGAARRAQAPASSKRGLGNPRCSAGIHKAQERPAKVSDTIERVVGGALCDHVIYFQRSEER